ncbi:MAG: hypothetical protein EOP04_13160 [Proteobacteria bacterium]|nr:MAG: hypothetical protein EOP04_13160 [Pseudomonadota bacterium]
MFMYLNQYGLDFFIRKLGLANPLDWHREQDSWARYLLNKQTDTLDDGKRILDEGDLFSSKVIRQIFFELNRFLSYLHRKRPTEVPPLLMQPFPKKSAALKENDARRLLLEEVRESKYIRNDCLARLFIEMDRREMPWRHAVHLMYSHGLRRNEALGALRLDVRKEYLSVERQLAFYGGATVGKATHKPVKDRERRKVPHWAEAPKETVFHIERAAEVTLHPDTISKAFSEFSEEILGIRYHLHDLRRTWVTNMLRNHTHEEVRLAAGHAHISTTLNHYVQDSRELADEVWQEEAV